MTEDEAIDLAIQHQQAGRTEAAAALYQQVIENNPRCPDALNLLGTITYQSGNYPAALELINQAIEAAPQIPMYYCNAGPVLIALGLEDEALASYRKAVELQPSNVEARNNIAHLLKRKGNHEEAVTQYLEAIRIRPDYASAHFNLGNTLKEMGCMEEALESYQTALRYRAAFPDAYINAGLILYKMGQYREALQHYEQALAIQPDCIEAYFNAGNVLVDLRRYPDAKAIWLKAHEMQPDNFEVCCGLGMPDLFQADGDYAEAIAYNRKALAIKPDVPGPYLNIGNALASLGRADEAIAACREACRLAPKSPVAFSNLLMMMLYSLNVTPSEIYAENLRFAERYEAPFRGKWPQHANLRDLGRRLKIGYVSGDFRNHSVAFFIEQILANHDKSNFEIYCYYNHAMQDQVTGRLKKQADHWVQIQLMSDEEVAARIMSDGIDILVDLSGHTAFNRLPMFARKPAPVQVTWIGYGGTTGLAAMDYRLTNEYLDPVGMTEHYHREELVRVNYPEVMFRSEPDAPEVNALPALAGKGFTFASLNNPSKLNERVVALWARILKATPGSRIMLGNAQAIQNNWLIELFARHGVERERLLLQPRLDTLEYLALHQRIDLALDPFPYNGGTTTLHALWMGVPVLTLAGDRTISRVGVSLMSGFDLSGFVAQSEEEYFERAVQLAHNLAELDELRHDLRARMTANPAYTAADYTRKIEATYRTMWQRWCARQEG